ncbi:hypothetical protein GTY81_09475 [Streptomyces sp. SID8366]|uniref:hypothetical protein n=1 Tax=unclassified Streptomyces TaxID=2593676 RepID=UPI000DC505D7|nr:hypothetical protein [Streptomyces sp. PsTaAH-130]MYU04116.1 hypothetical protein [Streptomyces sp. SID8366]MYU63465.1 hypothetical protein [Streptomyces sp. SID69]RAJ50057.1 hypothetical protein K376_06547 [Streptomyces sp. PsTaAH-130]
MTSSLFRGRPRRAKAHIRVRVTHAVLGALAGAGWLMLPLMTVATRRPVPATSPGAAAGAAAPGQGVTSAADYVLPLIAVAAAAVMAAYGYLRRVHRARTRTTPGTTLPGRPAPPTVADAERQARVALVLADDCVRTSREELGFARERFEAGKGWVGPRAGEEARTGAIPVASEAKARAAVPGAEPGDGGLGHPPPDAGARHRAAAGMGAETETAAFARALRGAEAELVAAFALWRRYERGLPGDAGARRQALAGMVGRCAEAGRRLDAQAAALDQMRGLEGPGAGAALDVAEGRFRGLAVRTVAAHATLAALRERYAPSAADPVTGAVEQAKDRLLFATAHLNAARRSLDAADGDATARNLRAAEGAVAQAETLVTGVERLAARLREAAALVPAALTGAEAELAAARQGRSRTALATGELDARLTHADTVLAAVREESTGALPYDPLDALRRITRAVDRLDVGRSGVLGTAAFLVARTALDSADDFVTVHRGAVGPGARALLSEAARALAGGAGTAFDADTAARQARELAERDVRAHGTPYPDTPTTGLPGAVLGGILLAEDPDGGPPATFGGPATRGRRHMRAPA